MQKGININVQKNVETNPLDTLFMQYLHKENNLEAPKNSLLIDMPVKAHIHKYLHQQISGPIVISLGTTFGILLYHLFRRQQKLSKFDKAVINYPSIYPIQISTKNIFDYGVINLTSYTIIQFNRVWDNEIKKECFTHVSYSTLYRGITEKQCIEEFLIKYNFLDNELSYSTLAKYLYRLKTSYKSKRSHLLWQNK